MSTGRRLLWAVLALTLAAALWPVPEDDGADGIAEAPSAARKRASMRGAPQAQTLRSLEQADSKRAGEILDLFPRQSFAAPAPAAAPETPPAPPLPFTYGGRYTEGNKVFVFLNEGTKMHTVRQGDTVKGTYRVEKVATDAITLTYLPLGLQQTVQTGSVTRP